MPAAETPAAATAALEAEAAAAGPMAGPPIESREDRIFLSKGSWTTQRRPDYSIRKHLSQSTQGLMRLPRNSSRPPAAGHPAEPPAERSRPACDRAG